MDGKARAHFATLFASTLLFDLFDFLNFIHFCLCAIDADNWQMTVMLSAVL